MQEQQPKSENIFQTLVENSLTGIYINLDEKIIFANRRFADIFGYTVDEIIGIDYLKLVHPEDRQKVQEIHRKRLAGEAAPPEYKSRGWTKEGRTIWINRRNTRIDYEGRPAILGNMVDITRQKQMNEKLKQRDKLASLGTLTAGVAHELNNPLNNISNSLQIILEEWEDGDEAFKKSLLHDVETQVERGKNIISALLEFSRSDELHIQPVDFSTLASQAVEAIKDRIPPHITVDMQVPDAIGAHISHDHVQRVLINLVLNAVDAMEKKGGRVRIAAYHRSADGMFCFEVGDTGEGIPEELLSKIFDPFYTTREPSCGTGLGLSITHGIVRQHSGRIDVESQPGEGSVFTVCFPDD